MLAPGIPCIQEFPASLSRQPSARIPLIYTRHIPLQKSQLLLSIPGIPNSAVPSLSLPVPVLAAPCRENLHPEAEGKEGKQEENQDSSTGPEELKSAQAGELLEENFPSKSLKRGFFHWIFFFSLRSVLDWDEVKGRGKGRSKGWSSQFQHPKSFWEVAGTLRCHLSR